MEVGITIWVSSPHICWESHKKICCQFLDREALPQYKISPPLQHTLISSWTWEVHIDLYSGHLRPLVREVCDHSSCSVYRPSGFLIFLSLLQWVFSLPLTKGKWQTLHIWKSSFPFHLFSSTEQGSVFGEVTALSALLIELLPAHHLFPLICWFITAANFQGASHSSLSSYWGWDMVF